MVNDEHIFNLIDKSMTANTAVEMNAPHEPE